MKQLPLHIIWLTLSGCLAGFTTFEEDAFLTDFQTDFCALYIDCADDDDLNGEGDPAYQGTRLTQCLTWTETPSMLGCAVNASKAVQCYAELQNLLMTADECTDLWKENILPSCTTTYVNCITKRTFGSFPE